MSDVPRGEGWWLASDLRWYPPESAEGAHSPEVSTGPGPIPELEPAPAAADVEPPPPTPTPETPGRRSGKPARRNRRLWVTGLALVLLVAVAGTAIGLRGSDRSPGSNASQAGGSARLPYSGPTTSGVSVPAPRLGAETQLPASGPSAQPCCRVPNVVGEPFVDAESAVYSAHLSAVEIYGTPVDCKGLSIPPRAFIIGREDPVQGSVRPAQSTVSLYFCDSLNK